MTRAVYNFHSDPGHGWLEVPAAELQRLGIADKVSGCSYLSADRKTVYLEEDCDADLFVRAMGGTAELKLRELPTDDDSFIRNLQRYTA